MSATPDATLLRAAQAGDAGAQTDLGIFYFTHGEYAQAVPWLQGAAEQALPQACNLLALMHLNGIAVSQQPALAVKYLEQAAAKHLKEACFTLANLLFNGIGVQTDESRAWELLLRAAESQHWPALRVLGVLHWLAGSQDEALYCLRLSARGGDPLSQSALAAQLLQSDRVQDQSEG
ncbi:MAG: tetratricopeptide repeat protein, partial [Bryobacteraceae bacterium]